MKNFLRLLNFELNRFTKLYIVMLIMIVVVQTTSTIIVATNYMKIASHTGVSAIEYVRDYSAFSMTDVIYNLWFFGPIAVCVAALLFYLFFIWYRDWFARNTFIYRLLMLPTSRMNIFFSKVTTIMLFVLGLVAYQIILLNVYNQIVKWIVPKGYRVDHSIIEIANSYEFLYIIIPKGFAEFVIAYGLGFAFVVVIFTAILFERSFRIKGIVLGALYVIAAGLIFALPTFIQYIVLGKMYLYTEEILFVQVVMWLIIVVISLLVSRYLLKNKVTV